jgi:hypothetical protein
VKDTRSVKSSSLYALASLDEKDIFMLVQLVQLVQEADVKALAAV